MQCSCYSKCTGLNGKLFFKVYSDAKLRKKKKKNQLTCETMKFRHSVPRIRMTFKLNYPLNWIVITNDSLFFYFIIVSGDKSQVRPEMKNAYKHI